MLNETAERLQVKIKTESDYAIQWLIDTQHGGSRVLRHCNLSKMELTEAQKNVLCRGLGFGISPRTTKEDILSEIEHCWKQLENYATSTDLRRHCKGTLAGIATKYANAPIDRTGFPHSTDELAIMKDLKSKKDIIISRPDKGNGVGVMDKSDCLEKRKIILSDKTKFECIGSATEHDGTVQCERALQALLRAVNSN